MPSRAENALRPAAVRACAVPGGGSAPGLLRIDGDVPQPRDFPLAALRARPIVDLGPTEVVCMTGRQVARAERYGGVRLRGLLEDTGLGTLPRATLKQMLVLCHAADGYRAVFSWNEIFNTPVGERVLVVLERGDARTGTPAEPLSLISAADLFGGPRNLRQLERVEVRLLGA